MFDFYVLLGILCLYSGLKHRSTRIINAYVVGLKKHIVERALARRVVPEIKAIQKNIFDFYVLLGILFLYSGLKPALQGVCVVGEKRIVERALARQVAPEIKATQKNMFDFYVLLSILCLYSGLKRRSTDTMLCEIKNILSNANKDINW